MRLSCSKIVLGGMSYRLTHLVLVVRKQPSDLCDTFSAYD